MANTFSEHKDKVSSNKVILAHVEPSARLLLWTLDSGAIYKRDVAHYVVDVKIDSVSLVEATSAALSAGEWFFDAEVCDLYIRVSDDSNPQLSYVTCNYRLFFSDAPVITTHDNSLTGDEVIYEPLIQKTSSFKSEVDSADQFGISLDGKGSINLFNLHGYFDSIFDKLTFENQQVKIYSWSKDLPADEIFIMYRGKIEDKSFTDKSVSFKLKDFISDLKGVINTGTFSAADGTITDSIIGQHKRLLYGQVEGVQTQSVDMVGEGYDLTGTISLAADATTCVGVGTSFLSDVSVGDDIIYNDIQGDEQNVSVSSITDDTNLVLSDASETTETNITVKIRPERPWREKNRVHFISGHKLRAVSTTVSVDSEQLNRFTVVDISDFLIGSAIKVDGVDGKIKRISGNIITLEQGLAIAPTAGQTVTANPVSNVYYNKKKLAVTRDYSISNTSTECKMTLTNTAEFNIARTKNTIGTSITFSNASRDVTGVATLFTQQLKPRDFLRSDDVTHTTYYEILEVTNDTALKIRVAYAGANNTGDSEFKNLNLIGDDSIIVCDAIGKENSDGDWVRTGSDAVKDLLSMSGITNIDASEFAIADVEAPYTLSVKVPTDPTSDAGSYRDSISRINQSIFGSLINNNSMIPTYRVLTPDKPNEMLILKDDDVLSYSVKSKTDIQSDWFSRYSHFDSDKFNPGESGNKVFETTSEYVKNVIGISQQKEIDIYLKEESDARQVAQRYAFFHELSQSTIRVKTKINTIELSVGDKIQLDFDRLYARLGQINSRKKVGIISSISKNTSGVELEISDLGNIFNRAANIADDTSADFTTAPDSEQVINGYIVDDTLEIPDTSVEDAWGVNLIS